MTRETKIWMPIYIADYMADTARLTTEQHGAYLLLLMDYWRNGAPPDDDAVLARIARLTPAAWRKLRPILAKMFRVADGEWRHDRIEHELRAAQENREKHSARAKKAAAKRWESESPSNATSIHQALLDECPSPSPLPIPKNISVAARSSNSSDPPPDNDSATACAQLAAAMRKAGVTITSAYPHLGDWLSRGLTIQLALEVVQLIRMLPDFRERAIPANYVRPKIEDALNPATAKSSAGGAWWSSPDGVMQRAQELGIEARPGEDMASFKNRLSRLENETRKHPPARTDNDERIEE